MGKQYGKHHKSHNEEEYRLNALNHFRFFRKTKQSPSSDKGL